MIETMIGIVPASELQVVDMTGGEFMRIAGGVALRMDIRVDSAAVLAPPEYKIHEAWQFSNIGVDGIGESQAERLELKGVSVLCRQDLTDEQLDFFVRKSIDSLGNNPSVDALYEFAEQRYTEQERKTEEKLTALWVYKMDKVFE